MRTDREMLAVGMFGRRSRIGDRIEMLMQRRMQFRASASRCGIAACAVILAALTTAGAFSPRWVAFAQSADRQFDVSSIRPNTSGRDQVDLARPAGSRFTAINVTLRMLIKRAYKLKEFELSGGPGWVNSDRYDLTATAAGGIPDEPAFKLMLQALLADRFHLRAHRETRPMPAYALVALKNGVAPANAVGECIEQGAPKPPTPLIPCGGFFLNNGEFEGRRVSTARLASALSDLLDRPVLDNTGFNGAFDFHLEFTFEGIAPASGGGFGAPSIPAVAGADSKPTIFSALQTQLGLKLESARATAEVLVIDHAEKPDAN